MKTILLSITLACILLIVSGGTVLADDSSADDFKVVVTAQLEGASDDFNLNGADICIEYSASLSDSVYQIRHMPPGRYHCTYNTFTASITITNRLEGATDIIGSPFDTSLVVMNNYYLGAPDDYCSLHSVYALVLDDASGVVNLTFSGIQIDLDSPEFFPDEEPVRDLSFFEALFGMSVTPGYIGQVEVNHESLYDLNNVQITIQSLSGGSPTVSTLISDVEDIDLPDGLENSLTSKLNNASKALEKGNESAAINMLNAFINALEAQRGKKISDEDADALIEYTQDIINEILGVPNEPPPPGDGL